MLQVSRFTVRSERLPAEFDGYTVVQLTDLHGRWFGPGNEVLVETVRSLGPQLIVMTGDMVNCSGDDGGSLLALAHALTADCPVLCIDGNHELAIEKRRPADMARIRRQLDGMGIVRLGCGRRTLTRGGGRIAVCGLELPVTYYLPFFRRRSIRRLAAAEVERRTGPAPKEFTLLLAHTPFYFSAYAGWGADLVFAGHVHGGMIRLPLVGGLLSPDWTLFPKYDAGEFRLARGGDGTSVMIVGRGMGSNGRPRIGNPPEVVTVTLHRPAINPRENAAGSLT